MGDAPSAIPADGLDFPRDFCKLTGTSFPRRAGLAWERLINNNSVIGLLVVCFTRG
jgi:hypothetical protein